MPSVKEGGEDLKYHPKLSALKHTAATGPVNRKIILSTTWLSLCDTQEAMYLY